MSKLKYKCKSSDATVLHACRNGDVQKLRWFKENYGQGILEMKHMFGKTPLHEAVIFCNLSCIDYLLKEMVDVDALKRGDWTPLMLACTKNDMVIIKRLVDHGSNLRLVNKDGWNCLHIAVRENQMEVVKYLLDIDISLARNITRNGRTPLHTACLHGHTEMVELLLSRCLYSGDEVDNCGTTPFIDALRNNHIKTAISLVQSREIDIYHEDSIGGRQAVHTSAQAGACRSIIYLLHLHFHHLLFKHGCTISHWQLHHSRRQQTDQHLKHQHCFADDDILKDYIDLVACNIINDCLFPAIIDLIINSTYNRLSAQQRNNCMPHIVDVTATNDGNLKTNAANIITPSKFNNNNDNNNNNTISNKVNVDRRVNVNNISTSQQKVDTDKLARNITDLDINRDQYNVKDNEGDVCDESNIYYNKLDSTESNDNNDDENINHLSKVHILSTYCNEMMTFINARSHIFNDTPLHLAIKVVKDVFN